MGWWRWHVRSQELRCACLEHRGSGIDLSRQIILLADFVSNLVHDGGLHSERAVVGVRGQIWYLLSVVTHPAHGLADPSPIREF